MGKLIIDLKGMRNDRGHARVALYHDPADFPKPVDPSRVVAEASVILGGTASVTFPDLSMGDYAVAAFHDENDNGKMDTNFLGMPKEGYGFANDPKLMRAPKFEDAKIVVGDGETRISVQMHYLPFS